MKFKDITNKINKLRKNIDNFCIGHSLYGQKVYVFHIGSYFGPQILLTGGIHAREYISTLYLLKFLQENQKINLNGGFYVVTLVNPDGVRLVLDGLSFIKDENLKKYLILINKSADFSLFKANLNGVDLNVNFDAKWGKGKNNTKTPSSANFIGYYKNSEIENQNLINFLNKTKIDANLAFHSKGEVVYYGFNKKGENLKNEQKVVNFITKNSVFQSVKTKNSAGGLSDFVSEKFKIFSATVELGEEELCHPIGPEHLNRIYYKAKNIPFLTLEYLLKSRNMHGF